MEDSAVIPFLFGAVIFMMFVGFSKLNRIASFSECPECGSKEVTVMATEHGHLAQCDCCHSHGYVG